MCVQEYQQATEHKLWMFKYANDLRVFCSVYHCAPWRSVRYRDYTVNLWCLQKERFLKTGWEHADALDMMTIYSMLPQDDVAR